MRKYFPTCAPEESLRRITAVDKSLKNRIVMKTVNAFLKIIIAIFTAVLVFSCTPKNGKGSGKGGAVEEDYTDGYGRDFSNSAAGTGWTVLPAPEDSQNKKRLLNYLSDQFGKNIISGQMDTSWTTNGDMDMIARVYNDTGKYPALKGFDFLELPKNNAPFFGGRQQVNEAIEWWEGKNNGVPLLQNSPNIHGIVIFCWHWRVGPTSEFYSDRTRFRIPWKDGKLDRESDNFRTIVQDLDKAAEMLKILQDRDIPVLWRPLHEASGGWFWWGASGAEQYKALWEFMHEYLTNVKQLNNLIWVWNADNAAWLPNPDTVDIVGRDLYSSSYASQKQEFDKAVAMVTSGKRIIALTENGRIPDPDECIKDGAMWSWFMTWNDRYNSYDGESHRDNFWTGELNNTQAHKVKVYNHPRVITLDKLPDLSAYRLD
jgi:mannan endo-1,4-beta-mannosidase